MITRRLFTKLLSVLPGIAIAPLPALADEPVVRIGQITDYKPWTGPIPNDYGRSKGIAWYYLPGYHPDMLEQDERKTNWDSAA